MYFTRVLILKSEDKKENDRLIVALSEEYGKITLIAKGVRKQTSKLASHIELFSLTDIGFVVGGAYNVLTSAIKKESLLNIKQDLKKLQALSYISDLVDKYFLKGEPDKDVSSLVFSAFDYLKKSKLNDIEIEYFLRYFEFKFLEVLGYRPKEKWVLDFFNSKKKIVTKKKMEDLRVLFLRYFKNAL